VERQPGSNHHRAGAVRRAGPRHQSAAFDSVLIHVAGGHRNREIGTLLGISEDTVKTHLKHIIDKLGARDRTGAVTIAVRRGIIQL